MLKATQQNLLIWQGDDFSLTLDLSPEYPDLTGYQVRAQIRTGWEDNAALLAVLAVTSLTGGQVRVGMLKVDSAALAATCTPPELPKKAIDQYPATKLPDGHAAWDMQVTSPTGVTTTVRWGYVLVVQDVTDEGLTPGPPPTIDPTNPYPQYLTEAEGDARYAPIAGAGSLLPEYPAGSELSALRIVQLAGGQLVVCDAANPTHTGTAIGITTQGLAIGALHSPKRFGLMSDPSWAWDPSKPVYAGAGGVLTQSLAGLAFALAIATVVSPNTIFIEFQQEIRL